MVATADIGLLARQDTVACHVKILTQGHALHLMAHCPCTPHPFSRQCTNYVRNLDNSNIKSDNRLHAPLTIHWQWLLALIVATFIYIQTSDGAALVVLKFNPLIFVAGAFWKRSYQSADLHLQS